MYIQKPAKNTRSKNATDRKPVYFSNKSRRQKLVRNEYGDRPPFLTIWIANGGNDVTELKVSANFGLNSDVQVQKQKPHLQLW